MSDSTVYVEFYSDENTSDPEYYPEHYHDIESLTSTEDEFIVRGHGREFSFPKSKVKGMEVPDSVEVPEDLQVPDDLDRGYTTELVYGRLPHEEEYALLHKESAHELQQAMDCSTWGEYAEFVGFEWETFSEKWEESLRRASGGDVNPDTPMDYREIAGTYYVADLVKDPRAEAYRKLPKEIDYSQDPVISEHVEMGGGSPGPNIDVITSDTAEALDRLQAILHDNGYGGFSIEQDEALVRNTYDL